MIRTLIAIAAFFAGMYFQQFITPPVYELQEQWHTVKPGETFWSIGCDYFDQQDRIKNLSEWQYHFRKYNDFNLRSRFLQVGDVVRVPLEVRVR